MSKDYLGTSQPTATKQDVSSKHNPTTSATLESTKAHTGPKTQVTFKYDVGFSNALYIRGKGANLSWDKGIMLRNVKPDEWIWETNVPFTSCEFKVLINDNQYETGPNHTITCGATMRHNPKFQ